MKRKIAILFFFLFLLPALAWPATYYVKTGGNDGASGLDDTNAWATIAKVTATATTGDTVYFRSQDTWVDASGAEVLPTTAGVTYDGVTYGTGTRAILQATGLLSDAVITIYVSNVTVKGFNITSTGYNVTGVGVNYPSPTGNISNITIDNCVVHDIGATDTTIYGIAVSPIGGRSVTNVTITNCTVYNTVHEGITLYPSWQQTGNYIDTALIRGCEVYNTGTQAADPSFGDGILIKDDVRNATVEFNYLHDNFVGIQYELYSAAVGYPNNVINRYNLIKDNTSAGIHFYITAGVAYGIIDIYGNLFVDNGRTGQTYGAGIIWYGGNYEGSTFSFYNNTIYSITNTATNKFGVLTGTLTGTFTLNFKNNIIYTDDHTAVQDASNKFTHSNNLVFRTSGTGDEHVNNGTSYNRAGVLTWEASAQNTDPTFKDVANLPTAFSGTYGTDMVPNNDGLSTESGPALDTGATLASYTGSIGQSGKSSPAARPQGAAFDIGAYEYVAPASPGNKPVMVLF